MKHSLYLRIIRNGLYKGKQFRTMCGGLKRLSGFYENKNKGRVMTHQDAITNLIDELLKTIDSQKGLNSAEKKQTRLKFKTVVSNFQKEFFQADLTKIVEWTEKNAIVPFLNSATTIHCAEVKKTMKEDTKEISIPDLIASAYQKGKEEHVSDIDIGIDILKSIGSW